MCHWATAWRSGATARPWRPKENTQWPRVEATSVGRPELPSTNKLSHIFPWSYHHHHYRGWRQASSPPSHLFRLPDRRLLHDGPMARTGMAGPPRCLRQAALAALVTRGATSLAPATLAVVWLGQAAVASGWPLWLPEGPLRSPELSLGNSPPVLSPCLKVAKNRTHRVSFA